VSVREVPHRACAQWPTNEYSGDITASRIISFERSLCSSQRFERALPLSTRGPHIAPERTETRMTSSTELKLPSIRMFEFLEV
jgi:hypothetical protein